MATVHPADDVAAQVAAYQDLNEVANLGTLASSANLAKPRVDGGRVFDPITDAKLAASRRLRSVEGTLKDQHGEAGLGLVRAVLLGCHSVEKVARDFGANSVRELRSVGWLFRKCLDVLARALGLTNSSYRPRPVRLNGDGGPDLNEPAMHASATEMSDAALRRGRQNCGY